MSDLKEAVSIHYKKFFDKFPEIETKPLAEWNKVNILSYFCKVYKDYYGIDFTFSFKGIPSKSREMFEISKLSQMISSQPDILKSYIDWVFGTKIIERKKRVTSLGYLTHPEIINEYKFKFLFNRKVDRTTPLPAKYLAVIQQFGYDITTYGELAFLYQSPDQEKVKTSLQEFGLTEKFMSEIK